PAGNTTPTWTTPTTGTVTGAGSLNFLPKYLSNGTDIGNSILKDLNGQLSTSTAQSVLGIFQGTTSAGYAEFHLKNDAGNLLVMGNYAVAKNTRQYIGYTRADTGLFESSGNGDTPSTVLAGVAGIRIVNTEGTLASAQADNSVQLLTHIYNGSSRVALHARYDGNIGIGTTSPNEKLQLAGNLNAYAPGGINAGLFASTAAGSTTIALRSSGVTHFNGGNVGINNSAPAKKLEISSPTSGDGILLTG
ncbi:unnamed protein product, partial [marine sediment metagenome]